MRSRRGARTARSLVALVLVSAACGRPGPPEQIEQPALPAAIAVVQGDSQQVPAGGRAPLQPTVALRDGDGRPLAGVQVTFAVEDGGWVAEPDVVTDDDGHAATVWYPGRQAGSEYRLSASAGTLQTGFVAVATSPAAGTSYFGSDGYIEFIPGELPIIISVPHGGSLLPDALPDRTGNVVRVRDAGTEELARDIADAFARRSGARPTLVISRLHRRKLDPNRDVAEAAQGSPAAVLAWREYHGFIEAARAALVDAGVAGLYIDLHGHGHELQRLELGYLLSGQHLALSDETLDDARFTRRSSLRAVLARTPGASHADLIRGPHSLGALFERHGYPAVPSPSVPDPGLAPFFAGGYSVARHGSLDDGLVAGVQIEANRRGVRDSRQNRRAFADVFAAVLLEFTEQWLDQRVSRATPGGR